MLMRKISFLVALLTISACGGGSSSSDIEIDLTEENSSSQPCSNYQSSNGNGLTLYCTIEYDNIVRQFFVYEGAGYQSNATVLFVLHGYTSRALWIMNYSGFQTIADDAGIIVIYPQGTLLPATGQTHWNVGGWTTSSTTDDVGFINSVINFMNDEYSINPKRIYSTGMSNGGYMSYKLACDLSSRIAAVASVTGSMTNQTLDGCNPSHSTSVAQIHGLQDSVVNYAGNGFSKPIEEVMSYWVDNNNCSPEPDTFEIFGSNGGGIHDVYSGCDDQTNVELFLMNNMGHSWPNIDDHDLQGSTAVWNFLSKYDIDGLIE